MQGMVTEVRRWQLWFPFLMIVITAVSVYDTWLVIRFSDWIIDLEKNPIGQWLLQQGDGNVGIFVRTKLAGTLIVLSTLTGMWIYRSRILFPVAVSVAMYQTGLLLYLTNM